MVLDIDTPVYSARKGFLAQAKRLDVGKAIDLPEHRRLINQCEKMLSVTAASMVFLYSTKRVHVVPAAAVVQHKDTNLYDILTYSLHWLYHDFAICWFGDPAIQATDRVALEGLRDRLDARAGVRLVGRSRDTIIYGEDKLIDPEILR
ncbi:hypothetical protein [Rhizorhabdus phycosphaerae]|uniref:hypothetical protein n=1 Tax=Rhizorhabdus phycosphaerae TaxID=2711156 RepID=UPI0013EBCFE5|nr:hypothetical protein [Rhizorhabdus phycosphaerae]